MKIGILGSSEVGRKLGDGLVGLGHTVMIGSRNQSQEQIIDWVRRHGKESARLGTFQDAASFGDIVIIATRWDGTINAINMAGHNNFSSKVVIDVTNPLDFSAGMPPKLSVGHTDSAGETIQRLLPDALVVKAFNTVGNPHFVHPDFPCGPPSMFICGNDSKAKKTVTEVLKSLGWEIIDIGGIEGSRLLEPLAMLWITCYFRENNGNIAFKLLRK
jgi:predicted dinucleotide-binding enzyme